MYIHEKKKESKPGLLTATLQTMRKQKQKLKPLKNTRQNQWYICLIVQDVTFTHLES